MAGVRTGKAGNHRAQPGIADPACKPGAQHARAQSALPGDDEKAASASSVLARDEADQLALGCILRVAVEVEASVDLRLAAADAALA
jgi:hypothetical protein